jgi:hypothetical protein
VKIIALSFGLGVILTISAFLSMGLVWIAYLIFAPLLYFLLFPRLPGKYSKFWNPMTFLKIYLLSIVVSVLFYIIIMKANHVPLPF